MTDAYVASLSASGTPLPGTLINVSSMIGLREFPGTSDYGVSKIGMAKITQFVHAGSCLQTYEGERPVANTIQNNRVP